MQQRTTLLLVLCGKRQVETFVQEFEDWKQEGRELTVLLYGVTQKTKDGFLLLELPQPLPQRVYTNLIEDVDVIDYLSLNLSASTPSTEPS